MVRVVIFLSLLLLASAQEDAISCKDHPVYQDWFNPPIIRSIRNHEKPIDADKVVYQVNHNEIVYRPRDDETSTKYENLDLFYNSGIFATEGRLSTLYLQKPAKVYMFVGMGPMETGEASFSGWKSEGYAELEGSDESVEWVYGVYQKENITFAANAYVFSKMATDQITLPSKTPVLNAMKPLATLIFLHFRIANADGTPYEGSKDFYGQKIEPNKPCPAKLHDAFQVSFPDSTDPDVAEKRFASHHPVWDPCFWCTFGHDHGSDPKHLMGIKPAFTYAAYKNDREDESDAGFKSYIFKYGMYYVYINMHVQTSKLRRVTTRYHTLAIVITVIETGEKKLELTHKADFGFLAVRTHGQDNFIPATAEDAKIETEMKESNQFKFRSVNVIDPNNINPDFKYRDPMMQGVYESWQTQPICSKTGPFGGIQIDMRTPVSGIESIAGKEYVKLMFTDTRRNIAMSRALRIRSVNLAAENCPFETEGGYFYTSPDGKEMFDGPGPGRIRQFIEPGFKIMLEGRYEALDNGLGLHGDVLNQFFWSHSLGVDPDLN